MKGRSLKVKFRNTFIKIISMTLVMSLLTFLVWTILFDIFLYPASFFEKQIPNIKAFISKSSDNILDLKFKNIMDQNIPLEGMDYQVIDINGNKLYGSTDKIFIKSKEGLIENMNKSNSHKDNYYSYEMPVLDKNKDLKGALILYYQLEPKVKSYNTLYKLLSKYLLFIPIIFLIIFTIYYSRKLSRDINSPLDNLMEAVNEIKNRNLDFSIEPISQDEIGELSTALEDMRYSLKSSLEEQWAIEEERKNNLSNLTHDLKTPLTIISTYSEALLNKDFDKSKQSRYLMTINKNTKRVLDMIANMNTIILMENPSYSLSPSEINIYDYLRSKLEEYSELTKESNIDYNYKIIDSRSDKLDTLYDSSAISQILDNIISNSIRFSANETIDINIEVFNSEFNFRIADTGDGLSPDDLKFIFEKFYRGDKSRSSKTGNSGLGMFITQNFVKAHGGYIEARNNIPRGTVIEGLIKGL